MFGNTFQWNQALARLAKMLDGAVMTREVAVLSMLIGVAFAILLTLRRVSGSRPLRAIPETQTRAGRSLRTTPAMAAGVTDRLCDVEDLVALVRADQPAPKKRGPYKPRKKDNSN